MGYIWLWGLSWPLFAGLWSRLCYQLTNSKPGYIRIPWGLLKIQDLRLSHTSLSQQSVFTIKVKFPFISKKEKKFVPSYFSFKNCQKALHDELSGSLLKRKEYLSMKKLFICLK